MIPIAKPCLGKEENEAVAAVLESGQLAQGAQVKLFEDRFAAYCGVKHAVATSSGTTALWIALLAHGIGPGDEVITSAFTFVASANAVLFTGAKPVFADIDARTFNLDPDQLEAKITSRTKAILPVHLFGQMCDMEAILALAHRRGLVVIEDACQAHGAAIGGRRAGSFGTGCFSFYATKNMTTGEGGMVTTDDDQVAQRARLLRAHGMSRRYYNDSLGYNFRLTEMQAAIGLIQLGKLDRFNEVRRANAHCLSEGLAGLNGLTLPSEKPGYLHVFNQFTVRVSQRRDEFRQMIEARQVGTGVYYPVPVHKQGIYRERGYEDYLPVTEEACRSVVSLPVHPALSRAELDTIIDAARSALS